MRAFLSVVFLACVSLASLTPASASGALDGKVYGGQVINKAKGAQSAQPDSFEFAQGKFSSALCARYGYGAGKYTATAENSAVKFEALTMSKAGGKMKWSGMVRGQDIEGICVTVENGTTSESWFKGRLK